jgi:multimeric flavodoxin WrbA
MKLKIAAINGSPRGEKSNSAEMISIIRNMLSAEVKLLMINEKTSRNAADSEMMPALIGADVLIVAFPLYVDGLPSTLIRFLERYVQARGESRKKQRVFALANCGFYEGKQNEISLNIVENFCAANGLVWGGGVGIGTGEMLIPMHAVPPKAGIRKPVINALGVVARTIMTPNGQLAGNVFAQHGLPWFLYKIMGEFGWRAQAKKNGLKKRDLDARPLEI